MKCRERKLMKDNVFEKIYAVTRRIPAGKVASYGQIALLAHLPRGAHTVGFAMAACRDPEVPCHRVVDRLGGTKAAFDVTAPGMQRSILESEGVSFLPDGRVDMEKCRWTEEKEEEPMLFLEYPGCSTCQKARKWLVENKIAFTSRNIREENPSYEELAAWHALSGLELKRFFNTSGLLYKSMGLKDRLPGMSEEEQLRLLATDGMLVRRPLVVTENAVLVGFRQAEWEKALHH